MCVKLRYEQTRLTQTLVQRNQRLAHMNRITTNSNRITNPIHSTRRRLETTTTNPSAIAIALTAAVWPTNFVRSLRSHRDVAGGGAPLAEALPLWHDTAVLRRADQLGRPGRELHGADPVCGCCVHRLRCAAHLHGHVLLAAHAAPLGGRSE